jgi:outer membrane immunogenic protein
MKKLTIAAAVVAFAGSAQAADLYVKAPPVMVYDWSGIYVGANAGHGWSDAEWKGSVNNPALPFDFAVQPKGALAGGQIGINRQWGNWVWGTEVTGDWSALSGTAATSPTVLFWTTKLRDLETLTGRLGYAFNNVLVYAKSGGATGVVSLHAVDTGGNTLSQSQRLYGGTAGAGIEYGLTPNWIVGVEYDYTRLFPGQFTGVASTGVPFSFGAVHSFEVQSVVGRVSYKF